LEQSAGGDDSAAHFKRETFFKGRGRFFELNVGWVLLEPVALLVGLKDTEINKEIEAGSEVIDKSPGFGILSRDEGVLGFA